MLKNQDLSGGVMSDSNIEIWGAETARTFRPIWMAEELGLAYRHQPIEPRTGETQTASYTALNRKQKVPFLVDGEVRVSESLAICRYLAQRYPSEAVYVPKTLLEQTKEDEWCCYIYGEIDETALYVMRRHGDLAEIYGAAPNVIESTKAYLSRHMDILANHLEGRKSVLDGGFGVTDIMLVSCIDWAVFYQVDVPPSVIAYRDHIAARPAYQKAMAFNYPKLFGGVAAAN